MDEMNEPAGRLFKRNLETAQQADACLAQRFGCGSGSGNRRSPR